MIPLKVTTPARPVLPVDPLAWSAREIEIALVDLMREATTAASVSAALRVYQVCETLRQELDQVITRALDRADSF